LKYQMHNGIPLIYIYTYILYVLCIIGSYEMVIWWYHYESDKYYTSRYVIVILVSIRPLIDWWCIFWCHVCSHNHKLYTRNNTSHWRNADISLVPITKCGCSSLVLVQWTNKFIASSLSPVQWN
jgi:hypothetical protein